MKKRYRIILIIVLTLLLIWLLAPVHLTRALIHGRANIDDYKIFENRIIPNNQPITWQKDSIYNRKQINTVYLKTFELYGTNAFVIIKNKKIVHEQYWNGTTDTTRSNSFSAAKSIIALLIGCLIDEGKITNTDQLVSTILPDFKNTNGYKLKIIDLLTMSSGIEWDEGYSSLFSVTTEAYYGKQLKELITGLTIVNEPGKIFSYQSCNTQLLAMIIEKASGMTVSEYASEKLWKPLGAEHPALWSVDREDGIEKAYCCFNSTATDFARIGQLVLDSGQFNNQQLISKSFIKEATTPVLNLKDKEGNTVNYYGYQFWLLTYKNRDIIYARGILGQYIFIIPSLQTVVVRLGTARSKQMTDHAPSDVFTYLDATFDILREK